MMLEVEVEKEEDGRWIAEVTSLPGVLACGATEADAKAKVHTLAQGVLVDRREHETRTPE